jgi:alkylhydroperoxidase family enzyme
MIVSASISEKEIVDLSIAIAVMNAWNRISIGFKRLPD